MESVTYFQITNLFAVYLIFGHHNVLGHKVDVFLFLFPMDVCFLAEEKDGSLVLLVRYEPYLIAYVQKGLCVRHELIAVLVQHTADNDRHMGQQTEVTYMQPVYLRVGQTHVIMLHLLYLAFLFRNLLFFFLHLDTEHPSDDEHGEKDAYHA